MGKDVAAYLDSLFGGLVAVLFIVHSLHFTAHTLPEAMSDNAQDAWFEVGTSTHMPAACLQRTLCFGGGLTQKACIL